MNSIKTIMIITMNKIKEVLIEPLFYLLMYNMYTFFIKGETSMDKIKAAKKAKELVSKMSLEEKASQMRFTRLL